ncbi:dipeptidase [Paenibacillus sp. KN14-4R]|uniref:dipeptidase n=1 Tax=Paenibacillus sp. KN14-4R TaxID=3445773 RepID=UPI003FA13D61
MIIDGHCDALLKLFLDPKTRFDSDIIKMQASAPLLEKGNVKLQLFAIFIDDEMPNHTFHHMLEYIDLFHEKVASHPRFQMVRSKQEFASAMESQNIGALLTIEGADTLMGDPMLLRTVYRLGVRAIGLTWNYANWAADGANEPRKGGLTILGKQFVRECNKLGMMIDVSHLSEKAFWDVAETSNRSFFASHSNAYQICQHQRNLTDTQIQELIRIDGLMGLNFVPYFVTNQPSVSIRDVLLHIDHVCALGGVNHVGFGADFDGIVKFIPGLLNASDYHNLADELYKRYKKEEADGFLYKNWSRFLQENLPEDRN